MSLSVNQIKMSSYLSSPLANSTKIVSASETSYKSNRNTSVLKFPATNTTTTATTAISTKCITLKEISISENTSETSISFISSSTASPNESSDNLNSARKSKKGKKPAARRSLNASKKPVEPIKVVARNYHDESVSVEKILKRINMTKYQLAFKKMDVFKFKELKEIDLNAIGITRPADLKVFMKAIKEAKNGIVS